MTVAQIITKPSQAKPSQAKPSQAEYNFALLSCQVLSNTKLLYQKQSYPYTLKSIGGNFFAYLYRIFDG